MIDFKLAELRKKNHLTQQQLGDILHVSYQTISKWETGVVSPDISILPQISSYFGVTVDALLGVVPLEQEYVPSNHGEREHWEDKVEYLQLTRKNMWNEDYIQFLIRDVWQVEKPISVLDCGCGYGALGLLLLPLLPAGSKYVGVDFTPQMLETAEKIYENLGIEAKFIVSDILEYWPRVKFDMVISQTILRHVNNGEKFLRKMASFVKAGGLLVSFEANRELEEVGLYIQGMDYDILCRHEGLRKLWLTELEKQNRDYAIAMKIPHYMKAAGLKNVSCRMNDKVVIIDPEQDDYDEMLKGIAKANHWDTEMEGKRLESNLAYFMNHGANRKEAEDYCAQQNDIVRHLHKNEGNVMLTKFGGLMVTYGWKEGSNNSHCAGKERC